MAQKPIQGQIQTDTVCPDIAQRLTVRNTQADAQAQLCYLHGTMLTPCTAPGILRLPHRCYVICQLHVLKIRNHKAVLMIIRIETN